MLPARFFARLFAVALMLGGLGAVTVLAPAGAAVQVAGGNAEVPPEIEEEKRRRRGARGGGLAQAPLDLGVA